MHSKDYGLLEAWLRGKVKWDSCRMSQEYAMEAAYYGVAMIWCLLF
jgi:hypothetical protein